MSALPVKKQVEIYHFVKFMKIKSKPLHNKFSKSNPLLKKNKRSLKRSSILGIIGLGSSGYSDISLHHDTYLYE
jgi:hypothetical protein